MSAGRDWATLASALSQATGRRMEAQPERSVGGGSINECVRWNSGHGPLFVKLGPASSVELFAAEADGLCELARPSAMRLPHVLGIGTVRDHAFLALEWIDFGPRGRGGSERRLGELLARQHRVVERRFGWYRDNAIGATPQHNEWTDDWLEFFACHRLGFQLDLAERAGHGGRWLEQGRRLCERLDAFFDGYRPQPSLLHGDLWGGNWAADTAGEPVLFDPATYYGDREADLAMTHLFGGFGRDFYDAYHSTWPLDPGAGTRRDLYNLYHVLNHLNLFGGGYRAQAEAMIGRLSALAR